MKFDWDESKNIKNFDKHGVWFDEAKTIWTDEQSIEFFDTYHSFKEDRFIRIGHSTANKLLLVIFCEQDSENLIRIISARKATAKERKQYEERV